MFKGVTTLPIAEFGESRVVSVAALWKRCHWCRLPDFHLKRCTACCLVSLLGCVLWRWISDVKGATNNPLLYNFVSVQVKIKAW